MAIISKAERKKRVLALLLSTVELLDRPEKSPKSEIAQNWIHGI